VGRSIVGAVGLAVVIASTALVDPGSARSTAFRATTYEEVSATLAALEVLAGVGLVVAAVTLLSERSTATLGSLVVVTSAAWFAPVWVGWEGGTPLVRSVGLVVAPLLPALVLVVAAWIPPATAGVGRVALIVLVAVSTLATAGMSTALALVRDPIRDRYCWSDCTANAFLVHDDAVLARRLSVVVLGLGATCGVLAALVGTVRLARAVSVARRRSGPSLAAAAVAGLALAAYALARVYEPSEAPDRPLYEWLFVSRALALLGLAAALVWLFRRPRLVRGLVTRLAVDLERSAAGGGLGHVLAGALGDPRLRLGYPLGKRIIDSDGRPLAHPVRRVTPIVGDEGVVALVESDATSVDALERELGPAAHLALGNERLRAEALARLADVTASRARIVETADTARRRMERDLHDGAQQRMLALTYDLRVALTLAESSGDERAAVSLREALDQAIAASQELRDIAHGIFPAELATSGLEAALESLADLRPLRLAVELRPGRRYRPDVETAAYAVVAEAAEDGNELDVTLAELDGALHVTVEADVQWGDRLVRLEDRVGAAGGSVRASGRRLEAILPVPPPAETSSP